MGKRSIRLYCLSTVEKGAGPVVIPLCASGKIHLILPVSLPVRLRITLCSLDICALRPSRIFVHGHLFLWSIERIYDWTYENVASEHKLTVVVPRISVGFEVHKEGTHE